MTKDQVVFYLNRLRKDPIDHVAEAKEGTGYAQRAAKVGDEALEVALRAVRVLPENFKLPTGERLFDD